MGSHRPMCDRFAVVSTKTRSDAAESFQTDPELDFDVFVTTYELIIKDVEFLGRFKWRMLVVDEGSLLRITCAPPRHHTDLSIVNHRSS
jgi:reverse gyrase